MESVLRGTFTKPKIDVYEIFWVGGGSLSWNGLNLTRDGERDLFLVRQEGGRWRVVQDWSRSIFPAASGPRTRLPLDDSHPFWERYALMNFWMDRSVQAVDRGPGRFFDFTQALGHWRTKKLLRGLLRHPSSGVRLAACEELAHESDECWEMLADPAVSKDSLVHRKPIQWDEGRIMVARSDFAGALRQMAMDELRVLTTITHRGLRREFCHAYLKKFPGDTDNGCSLGEPLPASLVTEEGDVPLFGDWP